MSRGFSGQAVLLFKLFTPYKKSNLYVIIYNIYIYIIHTASVYSYMWNFPRTIPRERISSTESFEIFLKFLKVMVYIILFCGVLACLVLSKGSLLLMTSTLNVYEAATAYTVGRCFF